MKTFFTSRQFDISKASQKNFYLSLFMFILLLGSGFRSVALTKTWGGSTGTTLNWTTAANWVGGVAPVAGDDIVFNTAGTLTFTTMPASVAYNSITVNLGDVTISNATALSTLTLGGNTGTDFTIASGASFTLGAFTGITLASNATASIAGTLTLASAATPVIYNTNGTSVLTTVQGGGSIINAGTIMNSSSKLTFLALSTYEHQQNGGTIPSVGSPAGTWPVTSTVKITGITSTATVLDQSFGNVIWNCPSQTISQPTTATFAPSGNFTITNTGTSGDITVLATTTLNTPNLKTLSVASGATLNVPSTAVISGTGTFTMSSSGILKIGSVDGISSSGSTGNIQTTTRNFSTGGNYVYNGAAQNTGTGLPNVISSLSLEGTGVKTFTSATNVTNNLKILIGVKASLGLNNCSAGTFTVNNTGGYNGTWGSTASSATNKSLLFFGSTGTGQLSVSTNTCTGVTTASIISNNGPTICSGNNVIFTLNGTPDGIVTYNLNGGANTDVTLDNSGAATITVSAAIATQVLNLVSAKNGVTFCPTSLSGASTVTVYHIPVINSPQPASATLTYGANATFTVTATSDHPTAVTYQWQENSGTGFANILNGGIYSGALTSSLILTKPSVALTGRSYRCVITNPCGSSTTNGVANLTVNAKDLTVSEVVQFCFTLFCLI